MMASRVNITDRAKRYRAQSNVTGPKKCVICGSTRNLDVMHLDGDESHGQSSNLAYGCRSCNNRLSAAFKRAGKGVPTNQYNPARGGIPTFQQYAWAVANHTRGAHDEGGVIIHATPKSKRIEYARLIAETKRSRGTAGGEAEDRWNPTRRNGMFSTHKHFTRRGSGPFREVGGKTRGKSPDELNDEFVKKEKPAPKRRVAVREESVDMSKGSRAERELEARNERAAREGRRSNAGTVFYPARRKKRGETMKAWRARLAKLKKNPAAASAEVFEEFHGYAPNEVVKVTRDVHHHTHLAAAGDLAGLKVKPISGGATRDLEFGKDCFLTFNERKTQLFITGGDQRMSKAELKKFGVVEEHELHTIGKLIAVGYFTDKTHLGDEGGEAVYSHTFKTVNENGKHVTVRIARYPDLIYRVLDEQFEISGGSYEILREGINK